MTRERRKRWGGFEVHPFIRDLDELAARNGFRFLGFDDAGTYGAKWTRPLFEGYDAVLFVHPEPPVERVDRIGFTVSLGVVSQRQERFEQEACGRCVGAVSLGAGVPILSVSLNWLLAVWEPGLASFGLAFNRWRNLPNDDFRSALDDLQDHWSSHIERFFALAGTPLSLALLLENLEDFPGKKGRGGPLSSDALLFAALLYEDAGDGPRALSALERHLAARNADHLRGRAANVREGWRLLEGVGEAEVQEKPRSP